MRTDEEIAASYIEYPRAFIAYMGGYCRSECPSGADLIREYLKQSRGAGAVVFQPRARTTETGA